jgi:hypothetical protein
VRGIALELNGSGRDLTHRFKLLMRNAVSAAVIAANIRADQKAAIFIAKVRNHVYPVPACAESQI